MLHEQQPQAEQPELIETDTTKVVKGRVRIMTGERWWRNPTPTMLARVTDALRYFCVAIMGSVSATDLFTGLQAKRINFGLSIFIYLLGGIDKAVGVEPVQREKMLKMIIVIWGLYALNDLYFLFFNQ